MDEESLKSAAAIRFGPFLLDPRERRLWRSGEPVAVNARYLDALILMASEPGALVTKDQFMAAVWRGVPVTDEALTQCIRTLRRALGDDASAPSMIETVPKHGYRFIAPVEAAGADAAVSTAAPAPWLSHALGGTAGAGLAGGIGGAAYGALAAGGEGAAAMGALSVLLVLTIVTLAVALLGGAGVATGIALAAGRGSPWLRVIGGAGGGAVVGGLVKLIGTDSFRLLIGASPGDITGAGEGVVLGGAVGLAAALGARAAASPRRQAVIGALCGAGAGVLIPLIGGRMMAGSLATLSQSLPASRLRLDPIGALTGEAGLGPIAQMVTGAGEGALFGALILWGMARASIRPARPPVPTSR
ncbi:winged helix-turn-helix domain-containing protein [Sphingomonas sp. CJ99]